MSRKKEERLGYFHFKSFRLAWVFQNGVEGDPHPQIKKKNPGKKAESIGNIYTIESCLYRSHIMLVSWYLGVPILHILYHVPSIAVPL